MDWAREENENVLLKKTKFIRDLTEPDAFVRTETTEMWEVGLKDVKGGAKVGLQLQIIQ